MLVERWTAASAVFYSILSLILIILIKETLNSKKSGLNYLNGFFKGINKVIGGLEKGAINMVSVAIAIATAGIIVGAVASTGLSNNLIIIVEAISGGNVIILLGLTAIPETPIFGKPSVIGSQSTQELVAFQTPPAGAPI